MPSEHRGAVLGRIRQVFVAGTTSGLSESELLERFVAGRDELAFEALVQRHGGMVWGVCRRLLQDPNDAEDAFQATFLVMVRKAGFLRDPSRLGPWLYGVAFRTASRARVNTARRKEREGRARRPEAVEDLDASSLADIRREIDAEILRLPRRFRQPVVLCHVQEKTVEEAARELGLTSATVRGRLFQARKRLRSGLERRGLKPSRRATLLLAISRSYPLPGHLVERTARFALGASGTAAVLAKQVASTMLWGQLKGVGIILGALLIAAMAGVFGGGQPSSLDSPNTAEGANPGVAAAVVAEVDGVSEAPVDPEALSKLDPYEPRPGRTSLEVVDAETGRPIQARIVRWADDRRRDLLRTDPSGRIELEYGTDRINRSLSIDIWAEGYALQRISYAGESLLEPIPEKIVARLYKGHKLGGRFVDEQGEPVSGVSVYLWSHNYKKKDPNELLFELEATSGPDGRWETRCAPEITGDLIGFRYNHPGYISEYAYVKAPPIAELLAGNAVTVLKKGLPFEGKVLDPGGAPVKGTLVMLTSLGGAHRGEILHTRTDEQGRFRFDHVKPGRNTIMFRASNFAPEVHFKEVTPGLAPFEVRLEPGKPFYGRVVDSEGRPINKARFSFQYWKHQAAFAEMLETDADGRFRWDHAPLGAMLVLLTREGYHTDPILKTVEASEKAAEFRMTRSLTIVGDLKAEVTGKPIERATFEFGGADSLGNVSSWGARPGIDSRLYRGRFQLEIDCESAPGFRVRIKSPGYEPFVSDVIASNRRRGWLDIKLKKDPHPGPSGVVLGPDGKPRAGVRVLMGLKRDSLSIDCNPRTRPECLFVESGPGGRYELPTTDEPYTLAVVDTAGFARYDSDRTRGLGEIRLEAWSRVEGESPDGPLPSQESFEWQEMLPPGPVPPATDVFDASGKKVAGKVVTEPPFQFQFNVHKADVDSEGRFAFDRVPPVPITVYHFRDTMILRREAVTPQPGKTVELHWDDRKKAQPR